MAHEGVVVNPGHFGVGVFHYKGHNGCVQFCGRVEHSWTEFEESPLGGGSLREDYRAEAALNPVRQGGARGAAGLFAAAVYEDYVQCLGTPTDYWPAFYFDFAQVDLRGLLPKKEHVNVAAVVGHEDGGFAWSAAFSEPYFDSHHAQKYCLAGV